MGIVGSARICLYSTSSLAWSIRYMWMRLFTTLHNYHIWSHAPLERLSFFLFLFFWFLIFHSDCHLILMLGFNSGFKCKFDNTSWKLWVANKGTKLPCLCCERLHLICKSTHVLVVSPACNLGFCIIKTRIFWRHSSNLGLKMESQLFPLTSCLTILIWQGSGDPVWDSTPRESVLLFVSFTQGW